MKSQHASVKLPGFVPLLGGLQISVEGCVVDVLELCGGQVFEATVETAIGSPVDPAGRGSLNVREVSAGAMVGHGGAHALGIEQPDHQFRKGVVIRVGHGPDRRSNPF